MPFPRRPCRAHLAQPAHELALRSLVRLREALGDAQGVLISSTRHDPQAVAVLYAAHAKVIRLAKLIDDSAQRHRFLEHVLIHREIRMLAE